MSLDNLTINYELCEELKRMKEEMEAEGRNGLKIIKDKWELIKPRFEYYRRRCLLGSTESLIYACLDNGIDPRNLNSPF